MLSPRRLLVATLVLLAAAPLVGCRSARLAAPPRTSEVGAAFAACTPAPCDLERAVASARVVCIGEHHDQRNHHLFQRDVLLAMQASVTAASRRDAGTTDAPARPLFLGMEMFQRPWQAHLDDYVAGKISEIEMLRRTEYYARWRFDHTMYAPLWRACREKGIRIIALNPAGEINRKVGREGLASLTPEERAGVAREIDLTVASHGKRIRGVFSGGVHPMPPERIETLYQGQTTWDETMAESAADVLAAAGPGARMLVIAGSYHVQEFDGVPDRIAKRLPGVEPLVIVCRVLGSPPEGDAEPAALGHFVVRTPGNDLGEAPSLGVTIEADGRIATVLPNSLAQRSGIEPGSTLGTITMPSGEAVPIADVTDVRYALGENFLASGKAVLTGTRADGSPFRIVLDLRAKPPEAAAKP